MKAATINELKQELSSQSPVQLTELCLRLAKFKKENKELLTYLLFEAHDPVAYIRAIKEEVDVQFKEMNTTNVYFVKKTSRKILRTINKYSRYSGLSTVEIELLIYFCRNMKVLEHFLAKAPVLSNLYQQQLKKIDKILLAMHEDLQYDYRKEISQL